MAKELELEYTYLINELPDDLDKFPSKIIEDNYIPQESSHPVLRIRRNGEKLEITKKYIAGAGEGVLEGDLSRMVEHTIPLQSIEYEVLNSYNGKKFKKRRFAYMVDDYEAELDVYLDNLAGLVVVDFEFNSEEKMQNFKKPKFVGADITQDGNLAGGMLCGKSYSDIEQHLREKYNYEPVAGVEKYEEEK